MMEIEHQALLVSKKILGPSHALLTFRSEPIAQSAEPGQFVNISCAFFLRRPVGICSVDKLENTFTVGIREVGSGTKDILAAKPGDSVSILGPLGQGFSFEGINKIITVGGGTGIFPLYFAMEKAKELSIPTICVNGFRNLEESFFVEECKALAGKALFSSDAGDFGVKGTVLSALEQLNPQDIKDATIFTVGPEIMMKHVASWATDLGLDCQVSLEKRMACGVGICLVCVCKVKAKESGLPFHHVRCCKEGPVFQSREVVW